MNMKYIVFGLILLVSGYLSGQSNENTSKLSSEEKYKLIELVDELLYKVPPIEFNLSSNDFKRSFADMSEEKKYDKTDLNDLLETLNKDKLNPLALYSLGDYYSNINNPVLANSYYQKSYDNLNIKFFENDSAAYYSVRAILKNTLGVPNALDDLDRSIALNPNDSLSMNIYPTILMSSRNFQKAREVLVSALETKPKNAPLLYLSLFGAEFMSSIPNTIEKENGIENYNEKYRSKNYNEMIDFTLLDKYARVYQGNPEIANGRMMIDIYLLFFKMTLFEKPYDFNYNTFELNKMEEIINKLSDASSQKSMNEFSINRCLGYVYFMLRDWSKSLEYFNRAIDIAPLDKESIGSMSNTCYDAIMTIYKHTSDTLNYRKTIRKKIDLEPNIEDTVDELMLLAFDYFISGKMKEAGAYCDKAMLIDSNNFDALRFKSHINFLEGNYLLSQFYWQNAGNFIRNQYDDYNLSMQIAIYQIYNGDIEMAQSIIELVKQVKGKDNCPLCDQLIEEYCNVTTE